MKWLIPRHGFFHMVSRLLELGLQISFIFSKDYLWIEHNTQTKQLIVYAV